MALVIAGPTNGTASSASGMLALFDQVLTYLNGAVPLGDVADGELTRLHIYRPEFVRIVVDRMHAQLQDAAGSHVKGDPWKLTQQRQRVDLFPKAMIGSQGWVKVPGMEWSGYVPSDAWIEVVAEWTARDIHNEGAGGMLTYPEEAGYFQIGFRDRVSGSVSFQAGSRRELYAGEIGASDAVQMEYNTLGYESVGISGDRVYDVFLAYFSDGAHADLSQVTVSKRNFVVEVFKDG